MKRLPLTAEILRELLDYYPATGEWRWRVNRWRVKAGDVAGTRNKDGRLIIGIDQTQYYSSRLAHLWMTGAWPEDEVDHHDLDPSNDKWDNLRPATSQQQKANRGKNRNNTSGHKNVMYMPKKYPRRPWVARITVDRRQVYAGSYATRAEAVAAADAAHKLHFGEFSRG